MTQHKLLLRIVVRLFLLLILGSFPLIPIYHHLCISSSATSSVASKLKLKSFHIFLSSLSSCYSNIQTQNYFSLCQKHVACTGGTRAGDHQHRSLPHDCATLLVQDDDYFQHKHRLLPTEAYITSNTSIDNFQHNHR